MAKIIYPDSLFPQDGNSNSGRKKTLSLEDITSEIQRRERVLLEGIGELCDVWIRKTTGNICGCVTERKLESAQPECAICHGVGYIGGYDLLTIGQLQKRMDNFEVSPDGTYSIHTPNYTYVNQLTEKEVNARKFLMRFPPNDEQMIIDKHRTYTMNENSCWMTLTAFILKPRDFVTRLNGERHRVKSARLSDPVRGVRLHQKVNVQFVNSTDAIYRVGKTPINYQSDPLFAKDTDFGTRDFGPGLLLEQTVGWFW